MCHWIFYSLFPAGAAALDSSNESVHMNFGTNSSNELVQVKKFMSQAMRKLKHFSHLHLWRLAMLGSLHYVKQLGIRIRRFFKRSEDESLFLYQVGLQYAMTILLLKVRQHNFNSHGDPYMSSLTFLPCNTRYLASAICF